MNKNYAEIAMEKYHTAKNGATCSFISIGDGRGLKLFHTKDVRDTAYEIQKDFLKYNLAPELFEKFDLNEFDMGGIPIYGYVTEEIDAIDRPRTSIDFIYRNEMSEAVSKCIRKIKAFVGVVFEDDHFGNFGFKGGELIPLDFDPIFSYD